MSAGRKPKVDFDSIDVLIDVEEKIRDGWDEKQIAERYGYAAARFSTIKNTKAPNGQLSKLYEAIKRGQRPLNFQVENSLFKRAAGLKVKTITRRWIEKKCSCEGDETCEICGGTGKISTGAAIVQEVEAELPPDTGAAMAWLKHNKPQKWLNPESNQNTKETKELKSVADFLAIDPAKLDMPDISHLTQNGTTDDKSTK